MIASLRRAIVTETSLRAALLAVAVVGLIVPLVAWSWAISQDLVEHHAALSSHQKWMEDMDREHAAINAWRDNVIRNNQRIEDMLRRLDRIEQKMAVAGIMLDGDQGQPVR